ncbi:MAG: thrombospondin type 3 repeat-containing protein, partial [Myxococcota bacterium]
MTITNESPSPQSLQVRKLRHQITFEDSSVEFADLDADNDGVPDVADNCPQIPNLAQVNTDGDLLGDACDTNDDNDAHPDARDNCPLVENDPQEDANLNRVGDRCEQDDDGDGQLNPEDNCPQAHNPEQEDANGDGVGDACDRAPMTRPCAQDSDCSSNSCDSALGVCRLCNPTIDCPLYWLALGEPGNTAPVQEVALELAPGESAVVSIEQAHGAPGSRWSGAIEVSHPQLGRRIVDLLYEERPEGVWTGSIYYLSNFGTRRLDAWMRDQQTRNDPEIQEQVGNALIQRWGAFRRGRITWRNFQAVLTATQHETWRWSSVVEDCPTAACYLFDSGQSGLREYSSDLNTVPVPTGVVELPMAMNLRMVDPRRTPELMTGRIESSVALQYAGDPEVTFAFADDPTGCSLDRPGACLVYIDQFSATIDVGGRYATTADDTECSRYEGTGGFVHKELPWLVPGFTQGTRFDPETLQRTRSTCRDGLLPFVATPPGDAIGFLDQNLSLASANPIPDGRTRRRRLELVDGALINQNILFVLFSETFDTFLTPSGQSPDPEDALTTYGYLMLERTPTQIDADDRDGNSIPDLYEGNTPPENITQPDGVLQVSCSEELLQPVLGFDEELDATTVTGVVEHILEGASAQPPRFIEPSDNEQVHYLCEDGARSWFDQGSPEDNRVCPPGARVTWFTVDKTILSDAQLAGFSCQRSLTCRELFQSWRASWSTRPGLMQQDPIFRCADPNAGLCDDNRADLRDGKRFYVAATDQLVMVPLYAATAAAFRYKTQFRNREGTNVGFAPVICAPDSSELPYCYDPAEIESIRERIDCLLYMWDNHLDAIDDTPPPIPEGCLCETSVTCENEAACSGGVCETIACVPRPSTRQKLLQALVHNFSYTETITGLTATPRIDDGFERLYAELLIMMGDESLTRAFASRFDLAGLNAVSFDGEAFEGRDGIVLSGIAGYEMYSLYQATQYYQEALDRFYMLSPLLGESLERDAADSFLTQEMVVWYMERLIRASTQKARSHAEIAHRYQNFNKPELARRVLERAYTGTHLESIIFAQLMLNISSQLPGQERPQILRTIDDGQRRYHTALLDMYEVYGAITDESNYFGFPADYIPFPALDTQDFRQSNAFEVLLQRSRLKVQTARERETLALNTARTFDTDAARFQAELVSIRNNHEDRLAEICGTFAWPEDNPTRIYPAIETYAELHSRARVLGDPCGLMGNGLIFEELIGFESTTLNLQQEKLAAENLRKTIDIEQQLISDQCNAIIQVADFVYEADGEVISLQDDIRDLEFRIGTIERLNATAQALAQFTVCGSDPLACSQASAAFSLVGATSAVSTAGVSLL